MLLNQFRRPIALANMKTHWLQVGVDLLQHLTERLRESSPDAILALAGGCVRDQLNALEPRDIDLCVINARPCTAERLGTESELYDLLTNAGYDLEKVYSDDEAETYATRFPGDEDRFDTICKYRPEDLEACGHYPLDVLFYNERYKTIADIAASHDHTINQFAAWFDADDKLQWKYFGDVTGWGFCMQIRNGITDERRARVVEICKDIGWTYAGDL